MLKTVGIAGICGAALAGCGLGGGAGFEELGAEAEALQAAFVAEGPTDPDDLPVNGTGTYEGFEL